MLSNTNICRHFCQIHKWDHLPPQHVDHRKASGKVRNNMLVAVHYLKELNVCTAFWIHLSILVASCVGERSFLTMVTVNNYSRTTVGQENCAFISNYEKRLYRSCHQINKITLLIASYKFVTKLFLFSYFFYLLSTQTHSLTHLEIH